jgi:hypothetical protein
MLDNTTIESTLPIQLTPKNAVNGARPHVGQTSDTTRELGRQPDGNEPTEPIITMALCEQNKVFLRPNILYRFVIMADCGDCAIQAACYTKDTND